MLTQLFFGNTIQAWLVALGILVLSFVLARALYWFTNRVLKRLADGTETLLDDIFIDMVEEPLVLIVMLAGARYAVSTLQTSEGFQAVEQVVWQMGVALTIAWLITRLYDALAEAYLQPYVDSTKSTFDDTLLRVVSKGVRVFVWSLGIIVGANNAGYDVMAIVASLGIGGIAMAMAAKDTVANIFGGVTVMWYRPFKIGEKITVAGITGKVKAINLRTTIIEDFWGATVTMPNKVFTDELVVNTHARSSYLDSFTFALPLTASPEQLQRLFTELPQRLTAHDHIVGTPSCGLHELGRDAYRVHLEYNVKLHRKGEPYFFPRHKRVAVGTDVLLVMLRLLEELDLKLALPTATWFPIPSQEVRA